MQHQRIRGRHHSRGIRDREWLRFPEYGRHNILGDERPRQRNVLWSDLMGLGLLGSSLGLEALPGIKPQPVSHPNNAEPNAGAHDPSAFAPVPTGPDAVFGKLLKLVRASGRLHRLPIQLQRLLRRIAIAFSTCSLTAVRWNMLLDLRPRVRLHQLSQHLRRLRLLLSKQTAQGLRSRAGWAEKH